MGGFLTIECEVDTDDGVDSSSVMISWMGPRGDTITNSNDSRVTISPTTANDTEYTSTLNFTYLIEGEEGNYTCNAMILEATETKSVMLEALIGKLIITTTYK